jgi:hypothetical protein
MGSNVEDHIPVPSDPRLGLAKADMREPPIPTIMMAVV